jgi:quercetin dioxygenase-like cupin family protein
MDALAAASNVHKLLNENDRVRVLKVVSKPGDVAEMHHHPDHVVYALKGGIASLTFGGKTQEMEIKTGSVIFVDAQDHEMQSIGKTTLDFLVVVLKKQFFSSLFVSIVWVLDKQKQERFEGKEIGTKT